MRSRMERGKYLRTEDFRLAWRTRIMRISFEGKGKSGEGGSRWRWQGLRQGWRGLEIAEIQNIFKTTITIV